MMPRPHAEMYEKGKPQITQITQITQIGKLGAGGVGQWGNGELPFGQINAFGKKFSTSTLTSTLFPSCNLVAKFLVIFMLNGDR